MSVFLLSATDALACDYPSPSSIEEHAASLDAIFLGEAIETKKLEDPAPGYIRLWDRITTFRIIETIKGDIDQLVLVRHPSRDYGDCTVDFTVGQIYEVYAIRSENRQYYTDEMHQAPYSREEFGWAWEDYRKVAK